MRGNTLRSLTAAALVSVFGFAPLAGSAESLSDAMVSAYRSSGLLTQQRALLRAQDEDFAVAIAATRPVINYSLNATHTLTGTGPYDSVNGDGLPVRVEESVTSSLALSATLSAEFTLYDFGRTQLGVDIARENVMMARDTLVNVEQSVLLRAVQAFLNVRSAHETAMLQANNVRLITEELRAARDRFEVGEITQTDVSGAEAALAAGKSGEAAARGQLMIAREEYKAAVGHYPNGLRVPPAVPVRAKSLDEAKALARRNHPDVLAAQRAVTVAELGAELARRTMLPTVAADATLTATVNADSDVPWNRRAQVGVGVSGPLYHGGKLSALYRKAKAQSEASRAALLVAVQGVEQEVANAWAQLAVSAASLQASDQEIRANQVALRGAREEATLGARTTLEVLSFEQNLLDAQAARISAQSDQYLAAYNLMAAMGILTADDLRLGIATYDLEAYFNGVKDAPVTNVSPQGEKLDALIETLGYKID